MAAEYMQNLCCSQSATDGQGGPVPYSPPLARPLKIVACSAFCLHFEYVSKSSMLPLQPYLSFCLPIAQNPFTEANVKMRCQQIFSVSFVSRRLMCARKICYVRKTASQSACLIRLPLGLVMRVNNLVLTENITYFRWGGGEGDDFNGASALLHTSRPPTTHRHRAHDLMATKGHPSTPEARVHSPALAKLTCLLW